MDKKESGQFYDLNKIRAIPILAVCNLLNVEITKKMHEDVWCKARNERTASTVLHLNKNTFHDFGGTGAGGSVIDFYSYVTGVHQKEAIRALAETFGIEPENRKHQDPYALSDWEWLQIGIYGDLATKNFSFDMERMPIERVYQESERYSMSMNELRKKYPKKYEQILRQTALPYIRKLRNEFYLSVYQKYSMVLSVGNIRLFNEDSIQAGLVEEGRELKAAESRLTKAIHGTSISFIPTKEYAPNAVLESILQGTTNPQFGSHSYYEMKNLARDAGSKLEYGSIPYLRYEFSGLDQFPHSGFLKGDRVIVGYLSRDKEAVLEIMNQYRTELARPIVPVPAKAQRREDMER